MVFPNPSDCPPNLSTGAAVRATGMLHASPRADQQAVEINVNSGDIQVIGECPGDAYPLAAKRHSLEYLREKIHLRPRTTTISAVLRIRAALASAMRDFFAMHRFLEINTPLITTNDCEGGGETFGVSAAGFEAAHSKVDTIDESLEDSDPASAAHFFGESAHLTVSGQLHAEALATALSRVYTFGPVFRAENSNTPRHLAEFYMAEAEAAFADRDIVAGLAENCIQHCAAVLLDNPATASDLEQVWAHVDSVASGNKNQQKGTRSRATSQFNSGDWVNTVSEPFAWMSYTDAIDALTKANVDFRSVVNLCRSSYFFAYAVFNSKFAFLGLVEPVTTVLT